MHGSYFSFPKVPHKKNRCQNHSIVSHEILITQQQNDFHKLTIFLIKTQNLLRRIQKNQREIIVKTSCHKCRIYKNNQIYSIEHNSVRHKSLWNNICRLVSWNENILEKKKKKTRKIFFFLSSCVFFCNAASLLKHSRTNFFLRILSFDHEIFVFHIQGKNR